MGRGGDPGGPHLNRPAGTSGDGVYFDQLVRDQGDFNPFTERGWRTLARRFAAAVGEARSLRLLDIGCGTGRSQQVYAGRFASYVGVDLSLASLRLASRRLPDSRWLQADALQLPFADGAFDAVAFSSVLHHIADRRTALAEARRVVRPGGRVFAFDPNLLHPAMAIFRHPRSPLYSPEGVSPDERPLLPSELRDDFRGAGFTALGQRCQSDIPYRAVAARGLSPLLSLYNAADWAWEHSGIGRWLGTFVVTWAVK